MSERRSTFDDARDAAPGMARMGIRATLRTWGLGIESVADAGKDALRQVPGGGPFADLIDAVGAEAAAYGRRVLGVAEIERRLGIPAETGPGRTGARGMTLRDRGAELLDRSSAVYEVDEEDHPAYRAVLEQLSPDEARVLVVLAREGPQPIADVIPRSLLRRDQDPIAVNVSMVDRTAGVRHPARMLAYWTNLTRLGVVEIVDKQMPDLEAYSVLSAQPEIADRIEAAGGPTRAKMVRRRVELTELGRDFTASVLGADSG